MLFNSLAENGSVRNFQTVMRGQFGTMEDVEVSGVAVMEAEPERVWRSRDQDDWAGPPAVWASWA